MRPTILLLMGAALTLFAQAPAPEQPVDRSKSRLVEVSVIVHDKSGPVNGLTAADFTVLDKGHEQRISTFAGLPGPKAAKSQHPENTYSNRSDFKTPAVGITVLLLDTLNTPSQLQLHARTQFLKALSALEEADHVAVYLLGTQLYALPNPHSDPDQLTAWIANNGANGPLNLEQQLLNTSQAMTVLARRYGPMPGRKNLIWISATYPATVDHFTAQPPPGWQNIEASSTMGKLRRPSDPNTAVNPTTLDRDTFRKSLDPGLQAISHANFSVYPVDTEGAVTSTGAASLRSFADDTSGRVYTGGNDIQKVVREIIQDAAATYTLGYFVDGKSLDSRFHEIKVQARSKDLELRFRKGYVALPPSKNIEAERTEMLREAALSPTPSDAIGLTGSCRKVDTPKPGAIQVSLLISFQDVELTDAGGRHKGEIELLFSPRATDGADRGIARQTVQIDLDQARYDVAMQQGVSVAQNIPTTGEAAEMRVIVMDHVSGRVGSLFLPVK